MGHGTYQRLRMIYRRIHNKEAVRIKEMDDAFVDNIAVQLVEEEERARKSLEMYRSRKERCEHLRNALRTKDDEDQTLCLEELPKLPDWKPRRRGRKRARSRSNVGGMSKRARIQNPSVSGCIIGSKQSQDTDQSMDPAQGSDKGGEYEETRSVRVIDHPETVEEIVIEDDGETLSDLEDINDPKPSCRKMISEKKKKKKKGKKKGLAVKRTYDEIIEAEIARDSDDCDLEVYFSGDLI